MKYKLNQILLDDCMNVMADIPDKYFELAIIDPPYGIGAGKMTIGSGQHIFKKGDWDSKTPDKKYFDELFRISKNQIIWGGNYYSNFLEPTPHWVVWDKMNPNLSFAEGELAWIRNGKNLRIFKKYFANLPDGKKIHPTQKPVALYRWLLHNYAKPGDKIIDTHSGSGSCAIACHIEKHDFLAIEKDPDYHAASVKRLEEVRAQGVLF